MSMTPRRRPATIKDVARELDISVATVSRAMSKPHLLRPATVARVREAVERLGYRPIWWRKISSSAPPASSMSWSRR